MMVVVAAAVVGGRRRRRKRGRTSGGTRVRRRGDWEGGGKVMVNTVREWSMVAKYLSYYRFQINCSFLPKSEIFYTPQVKNLPRHVVKNLPVD